MRPDGQFLGLLILSDNLKLSYTQTLYRNYLYTYQVNYIYGSMHVVERHAAANKFDLVCLYEL